MNLRRIALLIAGLLLSPGPASASSPCVDCNVILISLDTVGASHLGAYGSKLKTSPNLDRLAEKSRVYLNAYSTAPWTLPSHGSMLSGYYPWRLGLIDERDRIPPETPMLAHLLKKAGYQTFAASAGFYVDSEHGFDKGFDVFLKNKSWKDAETSVNQAIGWLEKNRRKKFFVFIHSYHAHEPFTPSDESLAELDPGYKGDLKKIEIQELVRIALGKTKLPEPELNRISVLYDAGIRDQDAHFGRLFSAIEKWGLENNTIVIVTSDHGEAMGEHGMWGLHAYDVYEELIRVPLIVKAPRLSPKRLASPVSIIDIVPTVLGMLKIKQDHWLDGRPLVDDDSHGMDRSVYAETAVEKTLSLSFIEQEIKAKKITPGRFNVREHQWNRVPRLERMVRSGNFKLILKFDRTFELYDLSKDPGEKVNLIDKEPAEAHRLKTMMLQKR